MVGRAREREREGGGEERTVGWKITVGEEEKGLDR